MVLFHASGSFGCIHGTYNAKRTGTAVTGDDAAGFDPGDLLEIMPDSEFLQQDRCHSSGHGFIQSGLRMRFQPLLNGNHNGTLTDRNMLGVHNVDILCIGLSFSWASKKEVRK